MITTFYNTIAIQTGYHKKPQAKLCCICKEKEVCTDSAVFGAGFPSQSKDFLSLCSQVCIDSLQHSKQRARLQSTTSLQEEGFSSVSLLIPITITASMRGDNEYHSAFKSCLQWVWALVVSMCHVPSMWTPYFDLSAFSVSVTFPFSSLPIVDCDGCILGDSMKRLARFSSSSYKQSSFFSWAVWFVLWIFGWVTLFPAVT